MRSICRVGFALVAWAVLTVPTCAQGLIHRLPTDGTTVRYQVAVTQKTADGQTTNEAIDVRISSVGVAKTDAGDVRWIEISLRRPERSQVLKVAIPEKRFGDAQNPFAHIRRAWLKRDGAEAERVDPERARRAVAVFLVPHFEGLAGDATETIETKQGKFDCTVREGKAVVTLDNESVESTGKFWVTPKAPLGWAQLELRRRTVRNGELVRESTSRFTIAEVAADARSALPAQQ